jgi:predicted nucleotidyltransferase
MGEYFGLKTQLESVLGRPVDLLVDGAVRNPYVLAGIAATRQLVYAA